MDRRPARVGARSPARGAPRLTERHEHEQRHGGARPPGHAATHWDERYAATDRLWSAAPNATIVEIVGLMPPGRALDVGAGEGRHAIWLAEQGWTVTAIDFSSVGIERGRAASDSRAIEWLVDDVHAWAPPVDVVYDLVLVAYIHLADDILGRVGAWVAPGGTLLVLGHALRNLTDGVGGPRDPRLLHTEDELRAAASGLQIVHLGEVLRPTPAGDAIDLLLVARRERTTKVGRRGSPWADGSWRATTQ